MNRLVFSDQTHGCALTPSIGFARTGSLHNGHLHFAMVLTAYLSLYVQVDRTLRACQDAPLIGRLRVLPQ